MKCHTIYKRLSNGANSEEEEEMEGFGWAILSIISFGLLIALSTYCNTPENKRQMNYGNQNSQMICPHCQQKGWIRTKTDITSSSSDGKKVAGALITGGLSLLVTGAPENKSRTQAHCLNCKQTWYY